MRTYYTYVSAFCGWAVFEGHLAENVAQRRNATEPIPDDGGHKSGDQQAWSAEDRQQLTTFVVLASVLGVTLSIRGPAVD